LEPVDNLREQDRRVLAGCWRSAALRRLTIGHHFLLSDI
jgi:hypothetical protein